jgi:hypothetical protein
MRYVPTTEQAKLIRTSLKEAFPTIKFSVRSDGTAIRVNWVDGPTVRQVDAVVERFAGGGFDGMQDLAYNTPKLLDGERVQFGGKYIFTTRETTRAYLERYLRQAARKCGVDLDDVFIAGRDEHAYLGTKGTLSRQYADRLDRELHKYTTVVAQASPTAQRVGYLS